MPPHRERGSVLVADLILASLVVLAVSAVTVTVGVVAEAGQASREAARTAAVMAARRGDPVAARSVAEGIAPPGASIVIEMSPDTVRATVSARVDLPHPIARRMSFAVRETVEVPVAPYRSNRG